ncbi:MAG: hypothetical protein FJZ78_06210 [Bacteroidetes bacterium]|nr:hypothetical protein [Bacteroidota bacterium]
MKKGFFSRFTLVLLGFLACATIILAGSYRIEFVKADGKATCEHHQGNSTNSDSGQKEHCDHQFISAPSEAVAGTSTTILDCPPYKVIVRETNAVESAESFSVTEVINNFFKVLVRSLIRANAP